MPFRAEFELKSKDCRLLWTKAITGFQSISDSFKIVIYQGTETGYDSSGRKCYSEVQFVTMNKTKTTILDVSFKECFFQKFKIDGKIGGSNSVHDNQLRHNYANCYTLIVNSKDMGVLFKECGEDAESWKIFMLASDEITQMVYSNKLFAEFNTKTDMTKKYSIRYRPGLNTFDSKIHCIYLKTLENQKQKEDRKERGDDIDDDFDMFDDEDEERIHRVAMESVILHRFIQTFPASIEDFMIEADPVLGKITFKGFNRSQATAKRIDRADYTKRPITLSITMSLDQTIYNNIKRTDTNMLSDAPLRDIKKTNYEKYAVSTRLKDLKTFIQIVSSNLAMFNEDKGGGSNYIKISTGEDKMFSEDENVCDIMYSQPGYPIIFERRYFLNGIHDMRECSSITLTEISDGQSNKIFDGSNETTDVNFSAKLSDLTVSQNTVRSRVTRTRMRTASPGPDALNRNQAERVDAPSNAEPLFLSENYDDDGEYEFDNNSGHVNNEAHNGDKENPEAPSEDFENIFWKNSKYHQTRVVDKSKNNKEPATIVDIEQEKENPKNNGDEGPDIDYLGPTQTNKMKGIFD